MPRGTEATDIQSCVRASLQDEASERKRKRRRKEYTFVIWSELKATLNEMNAFTCLLHLPRHIHSPFRFKCAALLGFAFAGFWCCCLLPFCGWLACTLSLYSLCLALFFPPAPVPTVIRRAYNGRRGLHRNVPIALCAFSREGPAFLFSSLSISLSSLAPAPLAIIYYVRENLRTPSINRRDLGVLSAWCAPLSTCWLRVLTWTSLMRRRLSTRWLRAFVVYFGDTPRPCDLDLRPIP